MRSRPARQPAFVRPPYRAGLRISEAAALHIKDIDSARMQLHVREAKGGGERYVPLSARLLAELRAIGGATVREARCSSPARTATAASRVRP